MRKRFLYIAFAMAFAAVGPSQMCAQSSNEGALAGTVTDPAGNGVAGALVTAANVATGQSSKITATAEGQFRFPVLAIGNYTVSVSAPGFKTAQRKDVAVQINSTTSLDIDVAVGSSSETVTVNAEAPQLQTESSDVGTVVTPRQVLDLPLSTNGAAIRNSQDFVFLTPATYGTGTNGGTFEGGVSGGQAFGSEILFDGASLQVESFGDGFANEILPSVESTGEFKVLVGGIPAIYGRTTGGVQSYSSKSGTNSFHGGAFELFRNTDLDANTWFNNLSRAVNGPNAGNATPADKKNNYGVLLGGPVWIPKVYDGRNKTFFFFAWEQFRQNQGYANLITIPTQANLAGDFSQNLTTTPLGVNPCDGSIIYQGQIFNPATTKTLPNGTQCRTAYPGNIIPSGLSTVSQAIASYIPKPTNDNLTNNYNFTGSYPIISTTETIRIDQSFGANNKVFGSYNVRDNVRNNNIGGLLQLPVTSFLTFQDLPTHLVRIGYDHIFSPTFLNHGLFAYTRVLNKEAFITATQGKDWSSIVGLPGGSGPLFPGIGINSSSGLDSVNFGNIEPLSNQGYNSKISDNSFALLDSVSLTKGRHNLSIGGEFRYELSISGFVSLTNGNFNFTREQTAATVASSASTGNGVASFLLGQVQNVYGTNSLVTVHNVGHYYATYIQDEFKYNRDLNLSLGLRYNVDMPFKEGKNIGSQFEPNVVNPATGTDGALVFSGSGPGRSGLSSRWVNVYYKNVQPRVGLTWSPSFLNHQTVVSATYNILTAGIFEWQQIYAGIPAGYSLTGQVNNIASPFIPAELLDTSSTPSPVVNPGVYGVPSSGTAVNYSPSQLNNQTIPWNQRGFGRPGFYQTWSATVQQQVATDLIFTLGYLGSRGTHLPSNQLSVNNINPSNFALGAALNDQATLLPYPSFAGTLAQSLRPYPQYSTINTAAYGENEGQLSYNAMTAKLERRYRNGLNLLASYTWSKIITDTGNIIGGSLGGAYTANVQNPFDMKAEKAVSPENTPQIFVLSYLYDLPFGRNKMFLNNNKALNYIVGGWSVTGIQRYQDGQPIGFGSATGVPGWNNNIRWNLTGVPIQTTARRNGSFNPAIAGQNLWYNRAAFTDPNANVTAATGLPYAFGNKPAYQDNDRSFAYLEEDFGLIKRTPITESVDIQFRAEFFNAFNRHVFGGPDSNPFDSGFGTVGGLNNSPRQGQLTLRLEF
jgi:Carboxypeptidase regulatory-like domain